VHWDGKLLPNLVGREIVDRLPVVVTSQGVEQLLAVPKLDSNTGEAAANAVYDTLLDWDLIGRTVSAYRPATTVHPKTKILHNPLSYMGFICILSPGMSYDTPSTNTGVINGASTILEKLLGKLLLHLACRHHVSEIYLKAAFESCFGATQSPEVPLFKRFQNDWSSINQNNFVTSTSSKKVVNIRFLNFTLRGKPLRKSF